MSLANRSLEKSAAKVTATKFGALGFLAVALGCAALAAFTVGDMMKSRYTGARVVPVVVATEQLSAGSPLSVEALQVRQWPEEAVPPGSYESVEALLTANPGSVPTVGILPGEPVVASRLSGTLSGTGVASLIRPHMRAIAMRVNDSVGYTGLVYPGAFVDVIATIRDPMGRGPSSRIAVQNARVLSLGLDADVATRKIRHQEADRLTGTPDHGGTYVTLEVTPEEAEVLSIANNEGKIDLILRNGTDDQLVDTKGATPSKFSAYAVPENPEDPTEAPATAAVSKPAPAKSRARKHRRGIQLVAHDEEDAPAPARPTTSRIETYHAR